MNNSTTKKVFLNTKSKRNLKQYDAELKECITAVHQGRYDVAKGLLNIDADLYNIKARTISPIL